MLILDEGCSGIIHVASDLSRDPNPNNIIPVVEQGVRNALAAAAHTPSVKRFVLTASSVGAMQPEPNVRFTVDEGSYNETAIKAAWEPPPYEPARAGAVYAASKAQGEKAAWAFIKNEKPSFTFNTVLPSVNLGTYDRTHSAPNC
jgi:nucleoside-diphosphate-sugar epimerase